jgi:hypothetical protein
MSGRLALVWRLTSMLVLKAFHCLFKRDGVTNEISILSVFFVKHSQIFTFALFRMICVELSESTIENVHVWIKHIWVSMSIQATINLTKNPSNLWTTIMTEFTMKHKKSVFATVWKEV